VKNTAQGHAKFGTDAVDSNEDSETVTAVQSPKLSLTKSANPTTYSYPGQIIVYTYVVKNTGNVTLNGPFVITDDKLGTITCQSTATPTLAPNASITCTKSYTIQAGDLNATNSASITNHATATGKFGTTTVTSNQAQATIRQEASTGKITPTATTCQQFRDGTNGDLTDEFYGVKGNKLSNTSPGVFFYYSKIKAPAASFTITVQQSNLLGWKVIGVQQNNQALLYDANCNKLAIVGVPNANGTVTYTVSGTTSGATLIIGIKYDPGTLDGQSVGNKPPYPTNVYTFTTYLNGSVFGSSQDSINVKPR